MRTYWERVVSGRSLLRTVNPEVAGSNPVEPAIQIRQGGGALPPPFDLSREEAAVVSLPCSLTVPPNMANMAI